MKKGLIGGVSFAIILICVILGVGFCIERIPNGYNGVQYSMNGGVGLLTRLALLQNVLNAFYIQKYKIYEQKEMR